MLTAPLMTLANEGEVMFVGAMTIGLVLVVGNLVHKILRSRAREQTKREIAAYVAEGSMTPEEGERLIKADQASWDRWKC